MHQLRVICRCFMLNGLLILLSVPAYSQVNESAAVHAVTYVDVLPESVNSALAALKQYRETSNTQAGYGSITLLEQLDRAGRLAIIEKWQSNAAFEGHLGSATYANLQDKLRLLRTGSYDQRPYHSLLMDVELNRVSETAVLVLTHVDIAGGAQGMDSLLQQYAEESRSAPGNVYCNVLQGNTRSNHFTLVSVWKDNASYMRNMAADYTRSFRNQLEPKTGSPLDERLYKVIN